MNTAVLIGTGLVSFVFGVLLAPYIWKLLGYRVLFISVPEPSIDLVCNGTDLNVGLTPDANATFIYDKYTYGVYDQTAVPEDPPGGAVWHSGLNFTIPDYHPPDEMTIKVWFRYQVPFPLVIPATDEHGSC